ncbi:hypothetical protein [Anaerotignum lactatifermentans]|uniref:hypothetical protein n=1 Tax=Anaerotignum lactatifermentans TaxID=160404 RepID=UPI003AB75623
MDAVEFLKEWDRMCKSNEKCKECDGYKLCTSEEGICSNCEELVKAVENWSKTNPVIILTEQQKTAIRGRIAEGFPWLVREGNEYDRVWFFENEPKLKKSGGIYTDGGQCSDVVSKVYDFVTFENSPLYLPDLLGGEE